MVACDLTAAMMKMMGQRWWRGPDGGHGEDDGATMVVLTWRRPW